MRNRGLDLAGADALRVPLPEGRTLLVRRAEPPDIDGLVSLYAGLSNDDVCLRFFSVYRPDRAFFERMVDVPAHRGDQIVATVVPEGRRAAEAIVAEAGYRLLPNGDGELAMMIDPRWRGWLGPFMVGVLRQRAAARGVRNLEADVLVTNRPMVAVLNRQGAVCLDDDDAAIVRLVLGTAGETPSWPAAGDRRRLLVEAPGGRWLGSAAAKRAGFDVLTCSGPRSSPERCPALRGEPCPLVTGADAVVVAHTRDDERWKALLCAHETLHRPVPIIVVAPGTAVDDTVAALLELLGDRTAAGPLGCGTIPPGVYSPAR